jgi:hypothetical protein
MTNSLFPTQGHDITNHPTPPTIQHVVKAGMDNSFVHKYSMRTQLSSHQSLIIEIEIVSETLDTNSTLMWVIT